MGFFFLKSELKIYKTNCSLLNIYIYSFFCDAFVKAQQTFRYTKLYITAPVAPQKLLILCCTHIHIHMLS